MGKVEKIIYEKTINPEPDRNANLLRVYRAPNQEVTVHFRNVKIVMHSAEEIAEWKRAFAEAQKKLHEISSNK